MSGGELSNEIQKGVSLNPFLIVTRAYSFYREYALVIKGEKDLLLKRYWGILDRQVETSVVRADAAAMQKRYTA